MEYLLKDVNSVEDSNLMVSSGLKERITGIGGLLTKEELYISYAKKGEFDKAKKLLGAA